MNQSKIGDWKAFPKEIAPNYLTIQMNSSCYNKDSGSA